VESATMQQGQGTVLSYSVAAFFVSFNGKVQLNRRTTPCAQITMRCAPYGLTYMVQCTC
jgi:hypothetical protein